MGFSWIILTCQRADMAADEAIKESKNRSEPIADEESQALEEQDKPFPSRKVFTIKGIICLTGSVVFLACAIALLASLPSDIPEPFSPLREIGSGTMIFFALIFILTALANLVTGLVYIFMLYRERPRIRPSRVRIEEDGLDVKSEGGVSEKSEESAVVSISPPVEATYPERFSMVEYEIIYQVIADPLADWDGERLYSLIDALHSDQQGDMTFPKYHPVDEEQVQD